MSPPRLPGIFAFLPAKHFETSTHIPVGMRRALAAQLPPPRRPPAPVPRPVGSPQFDFSLWTVGHRFKGVFEDISHSFAESLRQLGYSVEQCYGLYPSGRGRQVIVFGANVLPNKAAIPKGAVICQLEQFVPDWMKPAYLHVLRNHVVWDFSARNVAKFRSLGFKRVHLCRFGCKPSLPQKLVRKKDIDVLFYGSLNARRKKLLAQLRLKRLRVHDMGGWGQKRHELIARSKILLNIHYYNTSVLEVVRLTPAIEQGAFVVSETGTDASIEQEFSDGIVFARYEKLVETVLEQLKRPQGERDAIAANALATLKKFPHKDEIARCIRDSLPHMSRETKTPQSAPTKKRIQCFINNRNRLTWVKNLAREIERMGGEPIIVDNASTYPPLIEWYKNECKYRVHKLDKNIGSRAPWLSGVIAREIGHGELYVVTDPDLDLSAVPSNCLEVLARGLNKYGRRKAGLSLEIKDVPKEILDAKQRTGQTLEECESPYWKKRLDSEFYDAAVDTTFAMYRYTGTVAQDGTFHKGVRSDRPYTAKHLPWYRTESQFDEEDRYYVEHRQKTKVGNVVTNGSFYDSIQSKKSEIGEVFK